MIIGIFLVSPGLPLDYLSTSRVAIKFPGSSVLHFFRLLLPHHPVLLVLLLLFRGVQRIAKTRAGKATARATCTCAHARLRKPSFPSSGEFSQALARLQLAP